MKVLIDYKKHYSQCVMSCQDAIDTLDFLFHHRLSKSNVNKRRPTRPIEEL
jgi:hypothetical protein